MELGLRDKTCLVTASTGGLGFAIAESLAGEGADVVVNGRKSGSVAAAIERLKKAVPGARLSGAVGNTATPEGCDAVIAACPAADVVVVNLGIYEAADIFEATDDPVAAPDRDERHERGAAVAALPQGHAFPRCWPDDLHGERIRDQPGARDAPLQRHQDDADLACPQPRRDDEGDEGDGQLGPAGTEPDRGRGPAHRRPLSGHGNRQGRAPVHPRQPADLTDPAPHRAARRSATLSPSLLAIGRPSSTAPRCVSTAA